MSHEPVIPAKAGIPLLLSSSTTQESGTPAFAGVTKKADAVSVAA
jgi:hypothetical protein